MKANDPLLREFGILTARDLPSGELAGVQPFLFTWGLLVGVDESGYRVRYCYGEAFDALNALVDWDGQGDPPGPYIKKKGRDAAGRHVDVSRRQADAAPGSADSTPAPDSPRISE